VVIVPAVFVFSLKSVRQVHDVGLKLGECVSHCVNQRRKSKSGRTGRAPASIKRIGRSIGLTVKRMAGIDDAEQTEAAVQVGVAFEAPGVFVGWIFGETAEEEFSLACG